MPFDPVSAGFGIAGLATSIYGGIEQMNDAKQEAQISQQEVGIEEQQDATRQQAMHLQEQRMNTQITRNMQSQRAYALSAQAAGGGSTMAGQTNSSFGGAIGSISGAGNTSMLTNSANLQSADRMFALNASLDQLKNQMAGVQSNMATAQGISSLGSGLMGAGKVFGGG